MLSFKVTLLCVVILSVVSAESCSSGNTAYMCTNLNTCWSELGFGSRDDLKYLCELQGFSYPNPDENGGSQDEDMVVLLTPPRNITVPQGASAAFKCSADNALKIVIQKTSEMSTHGRLQDDMGVAKPTQQTTINEINEALLEHEGWYTCTAYGVEGSSVSAEAYLKIRDICANAVCQAPRTCKPDPYAGDYECVCPGDCQAVFEPVCASNCESYFNACAMKKETCEAGLTGVTVLSQGLCDFSPRGPRFTSSPGDDTVKRGAQYSLSASASGTPAAKFVWFVNGNKVGEGASVSGGMAAELEGLWTVTASNCHGTFESTESFSLSMERGQELVEPDNQCCKVYGDPHILTFDGKAYDYMGVGTFVIAQDNVNGVWMVYGTFETCGDITKGMSCVTSITVFYEREMVQFLRMWRINNNGNEFMVPLGSSRNIGGISIENVALEYVITIGNTGVVAKWDGIVTSQVCVSKCAGNVAGLCADANCDASNEFAARGFMNPYTGSWAAETSSEFGNSWAIDPASSQLEPEDGVLSQERTRPCDFIPVADRQSIESRCNAIMALGTFASMSETTADSDVVLQNCYFDGCAGLVFGAGCGGGSDCAAEIEMLIGAAMAGGMSRAEAVALYGGNGLDSACMMGMSLGRYLEEWGAVVGEEWRSEVDPPCPSEAQLEVMKICPT